MGKILSKVPPNGKGRGYCPKRPIHLIDSNFCAVVSSGLPLFLFKIIGRSGLLPRLFPFGGTLLNGKINHTFECVGVNEIPCNGHQTFV